MKLTTKYVGVDVHQATMVTTGREETGRVIARNIVPTEARAIVAFFRRGDSAPSATAGPTSAWLSERTRAPSTSWTGIAPQRTLASVTPRCR